MKAISTVILTGSILLSACSDFREKTWTNEITSISSKDGIEIRITESVTRAAWPVGTYQAQIYLNFYDGIEWHRLDESFKRTPVYSKLYADEDRFVQLSDPLVYYDDLEEKETLSRLGIKGAKSLRFPTGATYKTGYVWDVFVNPEQISQENYQVVLTLLQDNLKEIQKEIRRPRPPKEQGEGIGRHPTITSIVYRKYDYEPLVGIQHEVDVHFTSESSELFISQAPPNNVVIVLPVTRETSMPQAREIFETASIGFITDDQKHILIRKPSFNPKVEELVGENWMEFYETLRDSEGHNIFHYYKPIPWERNKENK